jgi:hypothetical protein
VAAMSLSLARPIFPSTILPLLLLLLLSCYFYYAFLTI